MDGKEKLKEIIKWIKHEEMLFMLKLSIQYTYSVCLFVCNISHFSWSYYLCKSYLNDYIMDFILDKF